MLDIYEMQVFLTAAETGSFSEAGRRLQLSQPAISMQIRSLEKRLNVELFQRSGRHIQLTEIGQTLVPLARQLINHAIQVEEAVQSLKGEVVGSLMLACSTTAGKYVLPELIAEFLNKYPHAMVTCGITNRGNAVARLLEHQAHIAITSLREVNKELEYRPFISDKIVLITPPDHPWAKSGHITIEDLPRGRYVSREIRSGTTQKVIEALAEYDTNPSDFETVMIMENSEAICEAVATGIGVAFVSHLAAVNLLESGRIAQVDIYGVEMAQQLYMVRQAKVEMSTVQAAFWDHVFSSEIVPNAHHA